MDDLIKALEQTGIGNITLITLVIIIAAVYFLYKAYKKFEEAVVSHRKDEEERNKKIDTSYSKVQEYEEHRIHDREQSRAIQKQLNEAIEALGVLNC